jgi:phosphoribosylanthranilate isomerase
MKTQQLKVKVCGMRDPENLEQVCALAPDYVGFIFYPGSKRFVGMNPDPLLFDIPGPETRKVGVFVNEEISRVRQAIESYGLEAVQLHGGESAAYCGMLTGETVVIKALDPHARRADMEPYQGVADLLLFDSPGEGHGGTGRKFDWELLKEISPSRPFLLSGGIAPGDAETIRDMKHRGLVGVDLNSRFEHSPGLKNITQLKEFIIEIRK